MIEYLPSLVALGGVMLGAYGSYRVMGFRLDNIERQSVSLAERIEELPALHAEQVKSCSETFTHHDVFKTATSDIRDRLTRIESKIDRINNGRS